MPQNLLPGVMTYGLTPTQLRILMLLRDGGIHPREDVEACLEDELSKNIHNHLTRIRKVLVPQGQTILCVMRHRRYHYCWTQLCPPAMEQFRAEQARNAIPSLGAPVVY